MALTRLATRGDLSQLRWARWQSARSFDAHSLSAYGPAGGGHEPLLYSMRALRCPRALLVQ